MSPLQLVFVYKHVFLIQIGFRPCMACLVWPDKTPYGLRVRVSRVLRKVYGPKGEIVAGVEKMPKGLIVRSSQTEDDELCAACRA
jgi:hypothetical protein